MLALEGNRADNKVMTAERKATIKIASVENEASEHNRSTIEEEAAEEAEMVKALEEEYAALTSPEGEQSEKKGGLREKRRRGKVEEELSEDVNGKLLPELPNGDVLPHGEVEIGGIIKTAMENYYGSYIPGTPYGFGECRLETDSRSH
eukprot:sb/3473728/